MALQSPGVEVTVIDESFYTPAEPGTTPLIVVATAQDKSNGSGTGVASATTKANAGKAFKLTSQRDLVDLYGVPFFEKTASSSPVHGSERNEYGLLAAYSLLGVSNAAFIVRADVDLNQLQGQTEAPGANPVDGKWWIDTQTSAWGIQEWNGAAVSTTGGQKFASKNPIVLTDADSTRVVSGAPASSVGSIGSYAVVFQTVDGAGSFSAVKEAATLWYKSAGNTVAGVQPGDWVLVGSQDWAASHPAVIGSLLVPSVRTGSFEINNTVININSVNPTVTLDDVVTAINTVSIVNPSESEPRGVFARNVNSRLYLYTNAANDTVGDSTRSNAIVISNPSNVNILSDLGIATGTYYGPALQQSPHTVVPQWKSAGTGQLARPTGSVWVKTTEPNQGARLRVKRWSSATESWVSFEAPMYSTTNAANFFLDRSGGGLNLPINTLFTQTNSTEHSGFDTDPATASFRLWRRAATGATTIISDLGSVVSVGTGKTLTIAESLKDSVVLSDYLVTDPQDPNKQIRLGVSAPKTVTFNAVSSAAITANNMATAINAAGFENLEASVITATNQIQITHRLGGDFRIAGSAFNDIFTAYNIDDASGTANLYGTPAGSSVEYTFLATNWQPLAASDFAASNDAPLNEPQDGQLWYNPAFAEVDIMVHNGNTWVGYKNEFSSTRDDGPIVSASNPFNGSTETGDLWISTADLENYPTIYRYNEDLLGAESERWQLVDKTDQVSEEGVLFADARWGLGGADEEPAAIADLLTSNYLDFDAPDPALYPRGMLLWNLRRSGGNVKRYVNNYVNIAADNARFDNVNSPLGNAWTSGQSQEQYWTDRWVTASPNNEDGSGSFGRKAQRSVVIAAMKSIVDTSEEIRDDERRNFNLISAPGYPELLSNLVNLNIDRGITSFVVGDTPLRLRSDATTLTNWGSNANLALDNGDNGIVTFDEYAAVFYPNGFTTDLSGTNAVVPASHMMLRTIALSDNVSYPWFAPAGTRRGGITNATAVGYIDALSGEFQSVALNEGQRDTLYDQKINPITFFNGIGLVNYGQKTRARNASALDRINVARLTVYLRSQLNKLARPYIFEPNDKITRDEIKQAVESLLLELVGLRALYDFAVVCDESNNTNARIDRNELWVDIAIEPVKAVEFIYIPLRVKNTGEI
jgi:hypothetical protein